MKDDTIALGNAILPILGDGVGLYSWDLVANTFCGDAETAHLFALDPMQLAAGVTVEMIIGCLHADDREYLAKSLHTAIIDGTLCRGVYRLPVGNGHYRQVLAVLRCFGYSDGLPTTCAGFVCEMPSEAPNLTPLPQSQSNVVQLRKLR